MSSSKELEARSGKQEFGHLKIGEIENSEAGNA